MGKSTSSTMPTHPAAHHMLLSRRFLLLAAILLVVLVITTVGILRSSVLTILKREKQVADQEAALARRFAILERRENRIGAMDDIARKTSASDGIADKPISSSETETAPEGPAVLSLPAELGDVPCRAAGRLYAIHTKKKEKVAPKKECSGRGKCNTNTGACECNKGYTGSDCGLRFDFTAPAPPPKKKAPPSLPDSNKWVSTADVAKRVSVILPFLPSSSLEGKDCDRPCMWLTNLLQSMGSYYPGIKVFIPAHTSVKEKVKHIVDTAKGVKDKLGVEVVGCSTMKNGGFAAAWNCGVAAATHGDSEGDASSASSANVGGSAPLLLLLSPETIAFHEHTNLELMVTQMISTDVDVLSFLALSPTPPSGIGADGAVPKTREDYLLHVPCWDLHHRRWMMWHDRPSFGYKRHERFVQYCGGRAGNSFMIRAPPTSLSYTGSNKLFNETMGDMAIAAFYADVALHNEGVIAAAHRAGSKERYAALYAPTRLAQHVMVGVCSECLLKTASMHGVAHEQQPSDSGSEKPGGTASHRPAGFSTFRKWTPVPITNMAVEAAASITVVIPPAIPEFLNNNFAEHYQVEMYNPPSSTTPGVGVAGWPQHGGASAVDVFDPTTTLKCVKSGGIYGHSNKGLYSPLCHRFQRQRDFLFLAKLWTDATKFNPPAAGKKKRYGISLHHGNLFGALRLGNELLWETDGDIDFISFDDTHDEMLHRWDKFKSHAEAHGFEIRTTYPEKPWYCSFLRDKTDFQFNARSVKDTKTRGKPPQVHNVSIMYQGLKVYMNGFQNPWMGIRADPGHDYRDHYLAQQGWVLHFTNSSIKCGVPGHNACLPDCNAPHHLLDHNYCHPSTRRNLLLPEGEFPMPVLEELGDGMPSHLMNPILWYSAEERELWNRVDD